jgi:hypothetical protein
MKKLMILGLCLLCAGSSGGCTYLLAETVGQGGEGVFERVCRPSELTLECAAANVLELAGFLVAGGPFLVVDLVAFAALLPAEMVMRIADPDSDKRLSSAMAAVWFAVFSPTHTLRLGRLWPRRMRR